MSKYFFNNDADKKYIVPFPHYTAEEALVHRLEDINMSYKIEVLDSVRALNMLRSILHSMVMSCRLSKTEMLTLDEEDLLFLCDVANKNKLLDFFGLSYRE